MPQHTLTTEIIETWTARLAVEAEGLDMNDADDRTTFRYRVMKATEPVKVVLIRALAVRLGRAPRGLSRNDAAGALANAWIARMNGTNVCKGAAC